MRILLVNPPARRFVRLQQPSFPLGLGYIAAMLRQEGHDVDIYDAEWGLTSQYEQPAIKYPLTYMAQHWQIYFDALRNPTHEVWQEVERVFRERNPQVLGITCRALDLPSAQMLARIAKNINPHIVVVFGGAAATTCTDLILQDIHVDFVVREEGEITMAALVKTFQHSAPDWHTIQGLSFRKADRIVHNPPRALIEDISALPYPARDRLLYTERLPKQMYDMMNGELVTSRGCPYNCTFCANQSVWGARKIRLRNAHDVVAEIVSQKETYHTQTFIFWDDLFTSNRARTIEICQLLLEKQLHVSWVCLIRVDTIDLALLTLMKRAGCIEVQVGVESGSDRILKKMQKGITVRQIREAATLINQVGLSWRAFMLLGIPGETKEEMDASMRLIFELKPTVIELSVFAPYPGSPLYHELQEQGRLNQQEWLHADYLNLDYSYAGTMPSEEFRALASKYLLQTDIYNNMVSRKAKYAYYSKHPVKFLYKLWEKLQSIHEH